MHPPASSRAAVRALGLIVLAVFALSSPRRALAQGCVAARVDAPALGAATGPASGDGKWEFFTTARHFRSDKHFVGSDHQENRDEEHSQVINDSYLYSIGFRYLLGERWSFVVTLPYVNIDRSSPLRKDGVVVDRSVTHGEGIGDLSFVAYRWMLDPRKHPNGNLAMGFGPKFPTGEKDQTDFRTRIVNGSYVVTKEEVDQSIQPGDGGLGFYFELQGYLRSKGGRATLYGELSYLFNPEETDHVETNRSAAEEKYMSIADQYLARVGGTFRGRSWGGWSAGGGLRLEGVPVNDAFGGSDWFRRPGYALSIEPVFSWSGAHDAVSVAIPVAVERNRQRSVPDKARGTHGDAAFADWSIEVTYSHRFGKKHHAAPMMEGDAH